MTWTLTITPNDQDSLGALMASVEDEVAREIRDAVLSIIARPVFERAEQAQKMHKAVAEAIDNVRREDWAEADPVKYPALAKRRGGYHRASSAREANRSDLMNIMARIARKGHGPMDLKDLTRRVNLAREERGDIWVTASSVRDALKRLVDDGKVAQVNAPRGKASKRLAYALNGAGYTCVVAGEGVRDG